MERLKSAQAGASNSFWPSDQVAFQLNIDSLSGTTVVSVRYIDDVFLVSIGRRLVLYFMVCCFGGAIQMPTAFYNRKGVMKHTPLNET